MHDYVHVPVFVQATESGEELPAAIGAIERSWAGPTTLLDSGFHIRKFGLD